MLLKYFITFIICIGKVKGAFDSILQPLVVHIVSLLLRLIIKLHTKCTRFGVASLYLRGDDML